MGKIIIILAGLDEIMNIMISSQVNHADFKVLTLCPCLFGHSVANFNFI